ncbi:MAG: hypothetical protein ABIK28_24290 [Planctomycetota bacterium]
MNRKKLLIIGAGVRVSETVLPAIEALEDRFTLTDIVTRSRKSVKSRKREYEANRLDSLEQSSVTEADLVYMAVSKQAVPAVLKRLARFDLTGVDLLIETPVLLFKHFYFSRLLKKFRNVWAAEDSVQLPCFDLLRSAGSQGYAGGWERVDFHHSAYKYHGLAMMKLLLGAERIVSAQREGRNPQEICRHVHFPNGRYGRVQEPRDYSKGWFLLSGPGMKVTDRLQVNAGEQRLEPIFSKDLCRGFRIHDYASYMEEEEASLCGTRCASPTVTVTSLMEGMKRVGFYRMLKRIDDQGAGYPVENALDDMVVDYYLDKLGFFFNPFMGIRTFGGRFMLNAFSGLLNRFG